MRYDERNREEVRQLEDDFFDWFETADADAFEDGTLDGFLEELEQADPLPGDFDPQKSLEDFHQKYAAFLEPQKEEKRQNRLLRRTFFAVAAVAAVLASMVTAQALGLDIFGFFGKWTDDVFTLTDSADKAGYQEQKRNYPLAEGESATFPSLDLVLKAFEVDLPLVPQWFPDRFGEFEVTGSVTPHGMEIFAFTGGKEDPEASLSVQYTELGDDGPFSFIEKDENPPITYESGGISHYIVTDHGICSAIWIRNNIECIIGGTVTIEELKQIIDSIYS